MDVSGLLLELYGRIQPLARASVEGLDEALLTTPPSPGANTIAWLIWHLARVQDDHVSELIGADQIWTRGTWAADFGLRPEPSNNGYGHTAADVLAVRPARPGVLLEYLDVVSEQTNAMLAGCTPEGLDRVVDESWHPPVTLGVRLVSIADDCLQHVGQAAYVRGLLER